MHAKKSKAFEAVIFGQRLRELRNARGWSQERLAEEAGITLNYVGNLERGEQGPSLHVLLRLARAFGLSAAELLVDFDRDAIRRFRF